MLWGVTFIQNCPSGMNILNFPRSHLRTVQGLQGLRGPQGTAGGLQGGCGERSNGGLGYTS